MMARPALADRGRHHRLLRDPVRPGRTSTCAARRSRGPPAAQRGPGGVRAPGTSATTSSAPGSTWTSSSTVERARTSAARRRRCSTRSRGYRGQPRLRPPFPATHGLYASPTVVNNVGDHRQRPVHRAGRGGLVPHHGYREVARPDDLLALRPDQQPRPVRVLAGHHAARADRAGRRHAARSRTASSGPRAVRRRRCSPTSTWTCRWTSRGWPGVGTMLGTTATQIFSDQDDVRSTRRTGGSSSTTTSRAASAPRAGRATTGWCGSCTGSCPGKGTHEDLDTLLDICDNLLGRSFCAPG